MTVMKMIKDIFKKERSIFIKKVRNGFVVTRYGSVEAIEDNTHNEYVFISINDLNEWLIEYYSTTRPQIEINKELD